MARKPVKLRYRRKVQQDALVKLNRVKEIRKRGKDGLNISPQQRRWVLDGIDFGFFVKMIIKSHLFAASGDAQDRVFDGVKFWVNDNKELNRMI